MPTQDRRSVLLGGRHGRALPSRSGDVYPVGNGPFPGSSPVGSCLDLQLDVHLGLQTRVPAMGRTQEPQPRTSGSAPPSSETHVCRLPPRSFSSSAGSWDRTRL